MRICSRCKEQIKRGHRYHRVKSRFLGFLWTVKSTEHYSCLHPANGPAPKRLKGEVPLPFPELFPESETHTILYHNTKTGEYSVPSPRQELADLN